MHREAPLDAEGILRALAEHGVDYVIIGGLAVQTHGHVRTTVDIDVLPRPDPSNMARLADALNALEARILNPGSEGLTIDGGGPDVLAKYVSAEAMRWKKIVVENKIKAE